LGLSSGGAAAAACLGKTAAVVGIAEVIPAETTTPLFNTSRLVHLRISLVSYKHTIAH
jgi:hypothetical protein